MGLGQAQSYDLVKPINIIGDPCVGLGQAQSYDLVKPINIIGIHVWAWDRHNHMT